MKIETKRPHVGFGTSIIRYPPNSFPYLANAFIFSFSSFSILYSGVSFQILLFSVTRIFMLFSFRPETLFLYLSIFYHIFLLSQHFFFVSKILVCLHNIFLILIRFYRIKYSFFVYFLHFDC